MMMMINSGVQHTKMRSRSIQNNNDRHEIYINTVVIIENSK